MSENRPYNPSMAVLAFSIDTDVPSHRIPIQDIVVQITEMDMEPELRNGHIAGLLAARLSIKYLETKVNSIPEKAHDIGILAMLGCHITEHVPLTQAEMGYAKTYQRIILRTRVLDDLEPAAEYSTHAYPSIASRMQERIRLNRYGYQGGRTEFGRKYAGIVTDYRNVILNTHPKGDHIDTYRQDDTIAPLIEHFLHTRRSLLDFIPELAAQEHTLWQYARAHYARTILPNVREFV